MIFRILTDFIICLTLQDMMILIQNEIINTNRGVHRNFYYCIL